MDEIFPSVRSEFSASIKVEGSRFIADLFPVTEEEEAKNKLGDVRKRYYDATHHTFAYIIGAEKNIVRYSDDGEPSGTAGVKIHSALTAKNCSDVLLVVTRYFGGTKLGVGGLGRAYFDSAEAVLSAAQFISKAVVTEMLVSFPFSETNPVMNLINTQKLRIAQTMYTEERSIITLQILPSFYSALQLSFTNATRGSAEISAGSTQTVIWS
ncbi:MAG: IMPACT family protein [Bacteroidota bacterium]